MENQTFLFINEQNKIVELFKQFLQYEGESIINNDYMFLMTGMIDGEVFKLEHSVSQAPIALYGNQTLGNTYRGSVGNESLLQKAGKLVKHIVEARYTRQLKQTCADIDNYVDFQDGLEAFKG